MDTEETIRTYFDALYGGDWEPLLADDMRFVNNGAVSPPGKAAYIEATRRFMLTAKSVEVKTLLIDGNQACALTHYSLVTPKGNTGVCIVAEFFTVDGGKIRSNEIVFDLAAFRELMAKG
jgi:hypothetical protein